METRRQERSQAKSNSEASINYTPNSIESGLYEMLQEYMVENENLRVENVELHHSRVKLGSDHETLSRDNERLVKKLEGLTRLFLASPFTPHAVESIPSTPAMDIRLSELTTPESTVHLRSPSPQSWASRSQPGQQLLPQKPPHHLPEAISKKLRKIEASQKTYSQQFQSRQLHKSKRQPSRLPQPVRPLWAEADVSCTSREVPEKRNAGESTPRKIVSTSSAESALDREVEEGAYHHVSALELSRRSSEEIGTQLHMRLAQDLHSLSGQIKQEQDRAHKRAIYAEE
ncbi:PREDICTED: uncharacterized protein LOC106808200 [Priapulus caudatus]|uniref:Uncharacterized protein LOC106808200 n=1 Tax=Priapulus caudatus TaxID=37621 RepID=A0ABM1E265_PRICU|nr:PREDICTED: uncharacterized protein LOC106808200 [Priapulus caudatus]